MNIFTKLGIKIHCKNESMLTYFEEKSGNLIIKSTNPTPKKAFKNRKPNIFKVNAITK